MTNVLQFTPKWRIPGIGLPQVESTRRDTATRVSNITDVHIPKFYLSRHTQSEYPVQDFLDVLIATFRRRQKPIITIIENNDVADCIVEVSSEAGAKYQLPWSYFYSLIVEDPIEGIGDYASLLCVILDQYNMRVHLYEESLELTDDGISDFIDNIGSSAIGHICEVYVDDRADTIGSIGTDNFINRDWLTLLDLMVGALYSVTIQRKDIYGLNMVIEKRQWDDIQRITIPARILLTIVYRAIANLHPLYTNFQNDKLLQWYMDKYIAAWFSQEGKLEK